MATASPIPEAGDIPEAVSLPTAEPRIASPIPGERGRALLARLARREVPFLAARRAADEEADPYEPIVLASGRGSNVVDADGNRYVDLVAGFGSVLLGHGSPTVESAILRQSAKLVQGLGDVLSSDVKIELLDRLAALHPDPEARVLLAQSGGDALTAAIKTSQLWTGRPGLVAFEGAYHGLGHAPLAICGLRESYRRPFAEQLNPHVSFAPFPASPSAVAASLGAVERALRTGTIGAVVVEPILGRGGCVPAPPGFLATLGELAREHGALLVVDEVWTGLGRSGSVVRSVSEGVTPDLVCLGKGLGGGLSISACIGRGSVLEAWARTEEVVHTSTHAGAPLPCAAALAVLDAVVAHRLDERSAVLGRELTTKLCEALDDAPGVLGVRGEGLMIGVRFAKPEAARRVLAAMRRRGYLLLGGGTEHDVVTWTPPLTIPRSALLGAAEAFVEVVQSLARAERPA